MADLVLFLDAGKWQRKQLLIFKEQEKVSLWVSVVKQELEIYLTFPAKGSQRRAEVAVETEVVETSDPEAVTDVHEAATDVPGAEIVIGGTDVAVAADPPVEGEMTEIVAAALPGEAIAAAVPEKDTEEGASVHLEATIRLK